VLHSNVSVLHEAQMVWAAMLDGWANQQFVPSPCRHGRAPAGDGGTLSPVRRLLPVDNDGKAVRIRRL
jgi:hypothetical protein